MAMGDLTQESKVVVIGAGPGGYVAAFRAADLGLEVTLVDTAPRPGGVCLFRGCIPSKTLLFLAQLVYDAERAASMGLTFAPPQVDLEAVRRWKDQVIDQLTGGLAMLSKRRDIQYIQGRAVFERSDTIRLQGADISRLRFRSAILATGSHPIALPGAPFQPGSRVMDSSAALDLPEVPERLLVVGGGYIGLELGSVYAALGSKVTLVELTDGLLPGVDRDLVRPLARRIKSLFEAVYLKSRVTAMEELDDRVEVTIAGAADPPRQTFDRVLVAIGRRPNSQDLGLENTAVQVDERGFVRVDRQQRTADPRILAIGDLVGGMMLAHKAMYEGRIAAEVLAGRPASFDARAIPAVVFTEPQIAWCGLTEEQARQEERAVQVVRFPWGASGRALTMDATEGSTKGLFDPASGRLLGLGIVGREAGELIAEGVLAVEMGALAEDIAWTVHAHPTLSETVGEVAELFLGRPIHTLGGPRRGN